MVAVYERLRDRLDQFPQGFPRSKSGVELKILKDLFSQGEAEIADYIAMLQAVGKATGKNYPFE
jgi:hypothetical protein